MVLKTQKCMPKLLVAAVAYHKITLVEKPGGDHFLGTNNQSGAAAVGAEILKWLAEVVR